MNIFKRGVLAERESERKGIRRKKMEENSKIS